MADTDNVTVEVVNERFFPSIVNIIVVLALLVWTVIVCMMDHQVMKKVAHDSQASVPKKRRESIIYARDDSERSMKGTK